MTKRQAITVGMKVDCLLWLATCMGQPIYCPECKKVILPGEKIQWDHRHALVHEGPHEFKNLRPVHVECHKGKTARDIAAKAKGDRILGLTRNGPKANIRSRGFDKTRTRKFSGEVVRRA